MTYWKSDGPLSHTGVIPVVMVLVTLGMTMFEAAQLPLLERSICRTYYLTYKPPLSTRDEIVPEKMCKTEIIQSRVAQLAGGSSSSRPFRVRFI